MNKKKKDVKKTSYYVTRSRVKVHTIFFLILILILKLSNVSEEVIVNHGIIRF